LLLSPLLIARPRLQSPSLNDQLLDAAGRGDAAAVTALLAKGADVNAGNTHRATPLFIAAEQLHPDVVKILLDHGADPNLMDLEKGRSPLKNASVPGSGARAKQASADIIMLLLAKGAGTSGESLVPLIQRGHIDAARTLIEGGVKDRSYLNHALVAARTAHQTALVELLVEKGAKDPGPVDTAAGRATLLVGVYRSRAGHEITLRPGPYDDVLLLDRPDRKTIGLLPVGIASWDEDLNIFRSVDLRVFITNPPGILPPREVTLGEGVPPWTPDVTRSEVFTRTADPIRTASAPRATENASAREPAGPDRGATASPVRRSSLSGASEWPSFRGPHGAGVADGTNPPTEWNLEKGINIKWRTAIPGLANSSPIIWGDKIFVATAVPTSDAKPFFLAGRGSSSTSASANRSTEDTVAHSWRVYALDRQSGRILWERVAREGVPRTRRHVNETQANQTPATDGTHLVVWFGSEGLYCYDLDGKLLWTRDLGPLDSGYVLDPTAQWNTASSPVIYKNLVIVQIDLLHNSYIAALDIETGKQVWRTERDEKPSWPTPFVYEDALRTELITLAPNFARAYDPATGRELWRLGKHEMYAAPTPIAGSGLIFFTSAGGNIIQPIYAVRPDGSGDITLGDDETSNRFVVWSKHRGGAFLSTPLLYRDLLYVCQSDGILSAYKPDTGERIYQARLPPNNYTASGVAADGKLYFSNADGDVVVVKAGPTFERMAVNSMGEVIQATPALSPGMIIFRTLHHVVAVAESGLAKTSVEKR
jgi:outer membrane protein assembly factor BamB